MTGRSPVWRLHPMARLHWRRWVDDWAVFDVGSGQTHQMDTLAAVTLLTLEAAPATPVELVEQIAAELELVDVAALQAALPDVIDRLHAAGLIEAA